MTYSGSFFLNVTETVTFVHVVSLFLYKPGGHELTADLRPETEASHLYIKEVFEGDVDQRRVQ